MKLDMHHKHIMSLIDRDKNEKTGWAKVSAAVFPYLVSDMPAELVELEARDDGGRARLTTEGKNVLYAMMWLD